MLTIIFGQNDGKGKREGGIKRKCYKSRKRGKKSGSTISPRMQEGLSAFSEEGKRERKGKL